MDPTDQQAFDVPQDERSTIHSALDHAMGILLIGGLEEEQSEIDSVRDALDRARPSEPVTLREVDAARAVASLIALREHRLDDGEVAEAAEAEEAIRTLTAQNEALEEMASDSE